MVKQGLCGMLALAVLGCHSGSVSEQGGKATGTLTVGASALPLIYACAFPEKASTGEDYRVFVTTAPLPVSALTDEFERQGLLRERKVQGLEVVVTKDDQVSLTQLYHPDLSPSGLSASGTGRFQHSALDANTIAGQYSLTQPFDWNGKPIRYEVTFSAPIFRRRPLTKADLESEPAQAARAFITAASKGDRNALRAAVTATSGKDLDGPDGKEIVETLSGAGLGAMTITWVESTGDIGKALLEEHTDSGSPGKMKLTLARENRQWKVSQPLK